MDINITIAKQSFLLYPTMNVYLDGAESAWLGNGEKATLSVSDGRHEITVKANMRSKSVIFTASKPVNITIRWNRFSGKIELLCVGEDVKLEK